MTQWMIDLLDQFQEEAAPILAADASRLDSKHAGILSRGQRLLGL